VIRSFCGLIEEPGSEGMAVSEIRTGGGPHFRELIELILLATVYSRQDWKRDRRKGGTT